MSREQRSRIFHEALQQLNAQGEGYIIFSDQAHPENFVQLTTDGVFEVTSRNYRSSRLPKLNDAQIDELVRIGFSREANPNHQGHANLNELPRLVDRIEQAFAILGVASDFELDVELGV
jgi:hypothetical protein